MSEPSDVRDKLRGFVAKNFYLADPASFADTTSFLDRGIIDSTGVLELVTFVEREWGLQVADEEMVPQNFDSIAALCAFVTKKRG
jgi:acyl carrier protein